ncbi:MAG: ABC-F family ATP-binding cassette domain-containing protein [Rhodobacteraceae bacterium]|nr:ABC-F family ATP-binding cassette domain-containing protein [Paracoccaceae bacterium]
MAPPLLTLTDVALTWGGTPLFNGVTCAVGREDRAALVGRNGSGKSTLLKIMAGQVQMDKGERFAQPGARISYLPQDPDLSAYPTLGDYAAADLEEHERYKAEIAMEGLEVRAEADPASASGGERRRAALARLLADAPDLMLLDEPTNHLDISAIEYLESALSETKAGFVLISHDRAFLSKLTRSTLWIDRGQTRRLEQGFSAFEDWRDKVFEEEEAKAHKLDRQIKREEHWIIHGVSGRRKRNVRRVAELATLREQKRTAIARQGPAAMALESGQASGKLVIEAKEISKSFGDRQIVENFSLKIQRRDRVALVGPNGVGKTTLLKMLIGEMQPDQGSVRIGANLETAVFDQSRAQLNLEASLWATMTEDPDLGVKGAGDQIMVRGRPKHVVGYLKEFLFDERQARGPVAALSGGERARLLLAKIMARMSNLLVLDEPTNDLDIETLDLLQDLLADYDGTLLLVSHDRDFIDRVADTTIAMEGEGQAVAYAGGWSDYQVQKRLSTPGAARAVKPLPAKSAPPKPSGTEPDETRTVGKKLSFKQERRLALLPEEIDRLIAEIGKLEEFLGQADLYAREPKKFHQANELLTGRREKLTAAEEEWMELEELRETLTA